MDKKNRKAKKQNESGYYNVGYTYAHCQTCQKIGVIAITYRDLWEYGLSSLISKVVQHKVICGIKISPRAPETSHLLFTDDNIIFGRATVEEATFLSHILKFYQKAFDQVINFDKIGLS
ncbi:hypothetical protein GmHk_06G016343 [Glycine max]|nr:hypothetical protein GmHk_06G016343 [Glycine max]